MVQDCGSNFFKEVYKQFREAKEEVIIMSFFLRPRLKLFSSDPAQAPDTTLTDLVLQAIQRKVHVWIMGWDNAASENVLGYFQDHEYELLFEAAGENKAFLHVMLDTGRKLVASVFYLPHMKSIVFDRQIAFVGGTDFTENRDDTPEHLRPDRQIVQVPKDDKHPTGNQKPWQDLMVMFSGRIAQQVAIVLVERWWTYCESIGLARTQALRPVAAILDSTFWHVKGALHGSLWKDKQCVQLPRQGLLGILNLEMHGQNTSRQIRIETPKIQSELMETNQDIYVNLTVGQPLSVEITGLHALDKKVPAEVKFDVLGQSFSANEQVFTLPFYGSSIVAQWLPGGVTPKTSGQMCKLTLSGSNMWMGTSQVLTESLETYLEMIRNSKRFLYIENQYFSTDFPSASEECQHAHDPVRAVLYSGAGNRIGEVLLDRIKRAIFLKEDFSVAIVFPLSTEPGAFYPNLRGAYCFEEAVEDFCQKHKVPNWRDYFSFFFLANAVEVPQEGFRSPTHTNAFYGIYTHTKVMIADDTIAYVGSANINDRSLLAHRDAELGVTSWGGSFPRTLRETLLKHHLQDGFRALDLGRFTSSLNQVAMQNAEELRETMGISFPEGTFKDSKGRDERNCSKCSCSFGNTMFSYFNFRTHSNDVSQKKQFNSFKHSVLPHQREQLVCHDCLLPGKVVQLFGMEGLLNHAPLEKAAIPYPRSRVVAGGGAKDHFDWFKVQGPRPPRLQGQERVWFNMKILRYPKHPKAL